MAERKKRKMQEINASSMADISFLLLIFFLVTTSMDVSQGLSRRLPPPLPPDAQHQKNEIKERNIFIVKINSQNELLVQGQQMDVSQLRAKAIEFIENPNDEPNLPEKFTEEVPLLGQMTFTKDHVISVQNDVDTQYQAYVLVQNELVAAYNELRNKLAMERFGHVYEDLEEDQQKAIQKVYPQKISEAEPKNYGGKKNG